MATQSEMMRSLLNVLNESLNEAKKPTIPPVFLRQDADAKERAMSDYDRLHPIVNTPGAILDYDPFTKTVRGFKLFRMRDGVLYPLFVDGAKPVPVGKWQNSADVYSFEGSRLVRNKKTKLYKAGPINRYVPATTGDYTIIPDDETLAEIREKGFKVESRFMALQPDDEVKEYHVVKSVAYRPGWHAGDAPMATHIGKFAKDGLGNRIRSDNEVWAEVEIPDDIEHQIVANMNATGLKKGGHDVSTAQITDFIPFGGHYRYKTNPNMAGNWMISGNNKVVRILSKSEAKAIAAEHGVVDLPSADEYENGVRHFTHKGYDPNNPNHLHHRGKE